MADWQRLSPCPPEYGVPLEGGPRAHYDYASVSDLYNAMQAYAKAGLRLLREVCPEGPPDVLHGLDEWRRDSDGAFRLYDREDPYWVRCFWRHADSLHSLNEYERLVSVLRATPHVAELLDTLAGSHGMRRRVETNMVADAILLRMARSAGLEFQESRFIDAFRSLDADLRSRSVQIVRLAPLLGLNADAAPISLAADLEIDRMTDEEICCCLRLGMLSDQVPLTSRMRQITSAFAVRTHSTETLVIGEESQTADYVKEFIAQDEAARNRIASVLNALRVFKKGRVSTPGVILREFGWLVEGATRFTFANRGITPWANRYELTTAEIPELQALWTRIQSVAATGAIGNAVRRFSYASERQRPDDALVDYMIAAESIFLSDVNQPDRGEMRYRLAHRAALFVDSPDYSRRQIFQQMRRAYDARSSVAHGAGSPDQKTLRSPGGTPLTLDEFRQVTEDIIRQALRRAIAVAKPDGALSVDWDALIFPD